MRQDEVSIGRRTISMAEYLKRAAGLERTAVRLTREQANDELRRQLGPTGREKVRR